VQVKNLRHDLKEKHRVPVVQVKNLHYSLKLKEKEMMKFGKTRNRRKTERGAILAMTALGMTTFILAAGLAVDISHFYTVGTELQNAADASALAGASALNHTAKGIVEATDRAVAAMNKYEFNGANVTISRGDVRFAVNLPDLNGSNGGMNESAAQASPQNIRFVKVNVPTTAVNTFFAVGVLGASVDLNRSAVAGQSSTAVGVNKICNPLPIALIEDDVERDCLNVVNPAECPNNTQYTPGCVYNVSLAPPCSASATKYLVLDEPTERCSTSDAWNKRIALGLDCVTANETLDVNEHISATPIRQAFNSRFNVYGGGLTADVAPPDANIANNITYAQYKAGTPSTSPTNAGLQDRRIMILPIVRKSRIQFFDGGESLRVNGGSKYGVFFLRKRASGSGGSVADIQVEYIADNIVVGDGSFSPGGGPGNTQITVPVLYR
jgi:Flp pilus assembly protein TadG